MALISGQEPQPALGFSNKNERHMINGKVAIVTGGASGIGKALCEELCRRNVRVVVADIDVTRAEQVAASLFARGYRASAAYVDVADADMMDALISDTVAEFGHLDYMFNNAAATATRGELGKLPLDSWLRAIEVNLLGVVHGTRAAHAVMADQGFGHIVNIGSIAGLVGFPTSIPYGATKAAVVNLSLAFRTEAADQGVKVSVVCPGPVHDEKQRRVKLIGVERAAQLILNGVADNRALIVFPFSSRLLWRLYRLSPRLLFPIGRKLVRNFRRKQVAQAALAMADD